MRRRSKAGLDGINFELALPDNCHDKYIEPQWLKSSYGVKYASVEVRKGILLLYVNLPRTIRRDNVQPFSLYDAKQIDAIRNSLLVDIPPILDWHEIDWALEKSVLKKVECNITQKVARDCKAGDVLNLLNRCCHDNTNVVYQNAAAKCKYAKVDSGLIVRSRRKNYYQLKCYDKSRQEWDGGNKAVESGLLRVEIIMMDRTIKNLFGSRISLQDIFREKSIIKVVNEYKRIWIEEIIQQRICPCLDDIRDILFKSLTQTDDRVETLALYREIIVDREVYRAALKRWYQSKGMSIERAKRNADTCMSRDKKYELPRDVIQTVREFKKSCG